MKLNEIISLLQADDEIQQLIKNISDKPAYDAAFELCKPIFEKHRINPTANIVRGVMKRGSNTTIEKAIIAFREYTCERLENIPDPIHLPFPESALPIFTQMWQTCLEITSESAKIIEANLNEKLIQTQQAHQIALDEIQTLKLALEQCQKQEAQANQQRQAAEKLAEVLQITLHRADVEIEELKKQRQQDISLIQKLNQDLEGNRHPSTIDANLIQKQYEALQKQLIEQTTVLQQEVVQKLEQGQQELQYQKQALEERIAAYQEKREFEQEKRDKKFKELKIAFSELQTEKNQLEELKIKLEKQISEQNEEIRLVKRSVERQQNHDRTVENGENQNRFGKNRNNRYNTNNTYNQPHKDIHKIVDVMLRVYDEQLHQFGQVDLYDYKLETGDALKNELGIKINVNRLFEMGKNEIERQGKHLEFTEKI